MILHLHDHFSNFLVLVVENRKPKVQNTLRLVQALGFVLFLNVHLAHIHVRILAVHVQLALVLPVANLLSIYTFLDLIQVVRVDFAGVRIQDTFPPRPTTALGHL